MLTRSRRARPRRRAGWRMRAAPRAAPGDCVRRCAAAAARGTGPPPASFWAASQPSRSARLVAAADRVPEAGGGAQARLVALEDRGEAVLHPGCVEEGEVHVDAGGRRDPLVGEAPPSRCPAPRGRAAGDRDTLARRTSRGIVAAREHLEVQVGGSIRTQAQGPPEPPSETATTAGCCASARRRRRVEVRPGTGRSRAWGGDLAARIGRPWPRPDRTGADAARSLTGSE